MSMQLHHTLMSQYKHGEASGIGTVTYDSVANCVTPEIVIYGKCEQNGTPTPDVPIDIVANNNVYEINGRWDFIIPTLYAVGDVRDEYYPQMGKVVRRCGKIEVPSGSISQYGSKLIWIYYNSKIKAGENTSICSHFKNVSAVWADSYNGKYGIYSDHPTAEKLKYFRSPNESVDTLDKFKAWIDEQKSAGTPVILVYVLAEPIIEYVEPIMLTSVRGANDIKETRLGSQMFGIPYIADTQIDVKYLTHV